MLKVLQAETQLQQQQAALAAQQAQIQAVQDAQQQTTDVDDSDVGPAAYPIYVESPFIPHVYRRNLYLSHRLHGHVPMPAGHPTARSAAPTSNRT